MEKQPNLRYSWYVVGILMLAYISSFIDRQILSLLVEPIKRDFNISDTQIGLLIGLSFAIFYTFLGIPIGRLADHKSRKGIIAIGITIWSFMTAICGITGSYIQLFIARIGVGVGEAALSPAAYSMISDLFPKNKLASALGVYNMGIYLGSGISLLLVGAILKLIGIQEVWHLPIVGDIFPWQSIFFIVGLPGLIIVLLLSTIKEPIRRELSMSEISSKTLGTKATNEEVLKYFKANRVSLLCISFGIAFMAFATYAATAWVPSFLIRVHGLERSQAGLLFGGIITVFSTLGAFSGGRYADYLAKKGKVDAKLRAAFTGMCFAIIASVGVLMPTVASGLPFLAINCFFTAFPQGPATSAIQEIVPNNMRATFSAFYLFIVNLVGIGLGPLSVGLLNDKVFHDPNKIHYSLFIVMLFGCAISCLVFYLGMKSFMKSIVYLKSYLQN